MWVLMLQMQRYYFQRHIISELNALFCSILFVFVLVLIQGGKALLLENGICFSGQRETMGELVKNQPSGTRWGLDIQCAQWEGEGGGGSGESSTNRQPASESESWWLFSSPSNSPSRLLNAMACVPSHPHQYLSLGLRGEIISWHIGLLPNCVSWFFPN